MIRLAVSNPTRELPPEQFPDLERRRAVAEKIVRFSVMNATPRLPTRTNWWVWLPLLIGLVIFGSMAVRVGLALMDGRIS